MDEIEDDKGFGNEEEIKESVIKSRNAVKHWSERSACAARAALQTGCVANVLATKFVVFFSLPLSPPSYFSARKYMFFLLLKNQNCLKWREL